MRARVLFSVIGAILIASVFCCVELRAQEKRSPQQQQQQPQVPQLPRKVIRIFLDKIEVAGRIEKPQAIFIIPGKSPEVEDIRIDRTFFREIFRKVEFPTGAKKAGEEVVRKEYILW